MLDLLMGLTRARRHRRPTAAIKNKIFNEKRQLLVDVSQIARRDARSGIQRVVRGLWGGLTNLKNSNWEVVPIIATESEEYQFASANFVKNLEFKSLDACISVNPGDVFLALDLSPRTLVRHEKQLADWKQQGVHICVVLYDLLPVTHPQWFNRRTVRNFRRWLATVERIADRVFCISNDATQAVQTYWQRPRWGWPRRATQTPDLATFPLGWDIEGSLPSAGAKDAGGPIIAWTKAGPTILIVGTIEPRKGHAKVLAAFERLWEQHGSVGLQLLIVGQPGWKTRDLQRRLREHPERNRRLMWCQNVDDMLLLELYRACSGVLVASEAEGFGLPVAEALANRRPVLARNLPVFAPFSGPNLTTFDDDTPDAMAKSILEWIEISSPPEPEPEAEMLNTWQDSATKIFQLLQIDSKNQ